jgi:short subunit dehydrogenase-like uncharacterized protein
MPSPLGWSHPWDFALTKTRTYSFSRSNNLGEEVMLSTPVQSQTELNCGELAIKFVNKFINDLFSSALDALTDFL